ncbi:MAG: DUF1707 domain-containing protein [Thermoleophilaceae bacterium]|nr:DUF1707 domain-containing protein [Thermoleophilaceae bacterium]
MNAATTFAPPANAVPLRVSDGDREQTVGILREHWMAGRLTLSELEDRSQEAWSAFYVDDLWRAVRELPVPEPPAPVPVRAGRPAEAIWSIVLSALGATVLFLSMGIGFLMALPLSATGWAVGRGVRRDPAVSKGRSLALAGETLGIVGTVLACLALTACAAWIAG